MKRTLIIAALFLCFTAIISAQDGYTAKNDSIQSAVLKQNRKITVFLPDGYAPEGAGRFPVIYVLDADGRDQHSVPTARFLFVNNKMPKAIIVGVFNIDRNHDFLPDSTKGVPTGGGADNFVRFFREELIPYIDRNYKTESYRVIVGHSFGGVFAIHALLTDPDLFNSYIAIDPSIWYKDKMLVKSARNEFVKTKNWDKALFITGREGEGMKSMGVDAMEDLLKNSAPKELKWKVVTYPGEDHGSVPFKSVYDGLRYIFDSGSDFHVYPQAGILPKGQTTFALIENNNPYLHYTLDGTDPTAGSPLCTDTIKINSPCSLKIKSIKGNYGHNPVVTSVFSEGDYFQGLKSVRKLKPGLRYSYYEGVWDSVPDFSKLKPVKTGITDNTDLSFALKKDSFAVQFEGYLHITKKDLYFLWIVSDEGSKVYLNNELLLDHDGLHAAERPVVKVVPLDQGYYPLVIKYFEKTGDQVVTVGILEKNQPVPIPKEMFYHREKYQ